MTKTDITMLLISYKNVLKVKIKQMEAIGGDTMDMLIQHYEKDIERIKEGIEYMENIKVVKNGYILSADHGIPVLYKFGEVSHELSEELFDMLDSKLHDTTWYELDNELDALRARLDSVEDELERLAI